MNGYVEQWGKTLKTTTTLTINLVLKFKDTNYLVFLENCHEGKVSYTNKVSNITTSSFDIESSNYGSTFYNFWKASSY